MYRRNRSFRLTYFAVAIASVPAMLVAANAGDIPRTADGRPDLSGNYETATLTPLQRPQAYGDKLFLTVEEAKTIEERTKAWRLARQKDSDPDRQAPPAGGDGSRGASGNVGGYNSFWVDPGDNRFTIDGKFRTSIIVDPPNGRYPEMTPAARKRSDERRARWRQNTGEAWWLTSDGPGPYDDPELRPLGERCLLGFGSTSGPPMLPTLYNNMKRIVQTPDHVMILVEMVHDARIIRLNSEHAPPEVRKWTGDSIGHWEGDTLVVDTTNFRSQPGLRSASERHVVERFERVDKDTLLYSFTVEDPTVWTEPWSGEYPWPVSESSVFEYACHEANYALGNIMRGARILEADAIEARAGGG